MSDISQDETIPMSEGRLDREKIKMVLEWAGDNPTFDPSFIESLCVSCDRFGSLTANQRNALDNIITKWRVGSDE